MSVSWDDLSDVLVAKQEEETKNNLLLIDGVNLAFRYIQKSNYGNFTDDYIRTINSLAKSYKAKKVICCFDSGASTYRKILFSEYKDNRKQARTEEEQERYNKFFDCLTETIDQLPYDHLKFKGVEADDLIAYLAINTKQYEHTWIISSDRDLVQLLSDNVSIFSTQTRKEKTIKSLYEDTGLTPREYMLTKILEGDTGDNISGITGIGTKRASDITKQYKTLSNLLKALPIKSKAQYIQNLNKGEDILLLNDKLVNLLDYHEDAILASEDSNYIFSHLKRIINES